MVLDRKALMLGVTGSFGSGCTTLAEALGKFGYTRVPLSSRIKKIWKDRHKTKGSTTPSRKELQDLGNEIRKTEGPKAFAESAITDAEKLKGESLIVFDGIRNTAEIELLRDYFPNFFLITVWCPQKVRWERVKGDYNGSQSDFIQDDKRDSNEELDYGQQVQLCVDKADIVIRNDEQHTPKAAATRILESKIKQYIELLKGETLRIPHHDEMAMAIAYTTSLRSMCLKRTVGAIITDLNGVVISTGYNENPEPLQPCIMSFKYCYKDSYLKAHFESLIESNTECPYCKKSFHSLGENFKCPSCNKSLIPAFSPDRGMSRCTAIHAENMAIMNAAGKNLKDTILYTTTFPCAQCARQIVYAGISEVVYIEPYPDPDSERFLR